MSCFAGKLNEYPNISVDCFDRNNLDSSMYFLSHCHQDHMSGLNTPTFLNKLKTCQNTLVYCSETTRNILLCDPRYKHLNDYLVGLPIEHPTNLTIHNDITGENESLCVTLLPAGHCIGSVMFFFEGRNGTVLYTGDFRLSKGDVGRIPVLHSGHSVKDITSIYVDTTFCLPRMMKIPSRERTKDAVVNLIKCWFQRGHNYYVSLLCKGMYGYEYLLKEVAIALKTKIHVSPERLALYNNLPDMTEYFTTDAKMTKIHSCNWNRDRHSFSHLPCGLLLPAPQQIKVMRIRPSSMWFARREEVLPSDCIVDVGNDFYRMVHSMHASMEEIIDLVDYLRPLNVYPTVEPAGLFTIKQAQESLKPFTSQSSKSDNDDKVRREEQLIISDEMPALNKDQKPYNFFSLMRPSTVVPSKEVLAQCKDLGLLNDVPHDVPRRRRRKNTTQNDTESGRNKKESQNETLVPNKRKYIRDLESKILSVSENHNLELKSDERDHDIEDRELLGEEKSNCDVSKHQKCDPSQIDDKTNIEIVCTV